MPLATMFLVCSNAHMEQIDSRRVSEIILTAPSWAKIGITMPDEALRIRAANELALTISERLADSLTTADRDQLALPL
jgi:hypothetical protein